MSASLNWPEGKQVDNICGENCLLLNMFVDVFVCNCGWQIPGRFLGLKRYSWLIDCCFKLVLDLVGPPVPFPLQFKAMLPCAENWALAVPSSLILDVTFLTHSCQRCLQTPKLIVWHTYTHSYTHTRKRQVPLGLDHCPPCTSSPHGSSSTSIQLWTLLSFPGWLIRLFALLICLNWWLMAWFQGWILISLCN